MFIMGWYTEQKFKCLTKNQKRNLLKTLKIIAGQCFVIKESRCIVYCVVYDGVVRVCNPTARRSVGVDPIKMAAVAERGMTVRRHLLCRVAVHI